MVRTKDRSNLIQTKATDQTSDPLKVSEFAIAAANGLTTEGVAPSPKHFPGHGDTCVDSHLGLPRIMKTKKELQSVELVPFKNIIAAGAPTIMTGHMALPLVTGDDKPCSLSRVITTGLLRDELGYDGVIVTDCLEMDAIVKTYGCEAGAVEALKAGADIAMLCHRIDRQTGAIEAVYDAISSGVLPIQALKASGERIRKLKERFVGSWEDVISPDLDMRAFEEQQHLSREVQQEAYSRSIAVVNDKNHILPIGGSPSIANSESIVLFTPALGKLNPAVDDPESFVRNADGVLRNTAGPSYLFLADVISRKTSTSSIRHVVYGPNDKPFLNNLEGTTIIFTTRQAEQTPWQLEYLRDLIQASHPTFRSIVVLASLTPYEVLSPIAGPKAAYICTFEYTSEALQAAASIIFGETSARGVLPVKKYHGSPS